MEKRATHDQRSGPHSLAKSHAQVCTGCATEEAVVSTLELKEKRREDMSVTEVNAIRYASGYVVTKLKEKYMKKDSVSISRCLLSMEEGVTRLREAETDDDIGESFLA